MKTLFTRFTGLSIFLLFIGAHGMAQELQPATSAANTSALSAVDGKDVRIYPSADTQTQVTIIINKKNPLNLVAACNTFGVPNNYFNEGYYSSHDGGTTWTGNNYLPASTQIHIRNDASPSLAFSTDTIAFLTTQDQSYGYWIQKSYNGGISFNAAKNADSSLIYVYDPYIAIDDQTSSPYTNYFYCAWYDGFHGGIGFHKSTDKANTFSSEQFLRPPSTAGFGQGTNVQTGPNGELYVCWADHSQNVTPYAADGLGFASSFDGGSTFTPYRIIFPYTGIRTEYTSATFNFTRTKDFPAMAVDKSSGVHRGRIYIVYPSKETGKAVIYIRYSDDKGSTWSAAKAISIAKASQSFLPNIAVDDTNGNVYVDYYAFDNPGSSYSTNTYMAGSTNGGTTWKNLKVSDVPHITQAIKGGSFEEGYYGNYIGIAAYAGKVYPAWMDNRSGTWQIYVSKVTVSTAAVAITAAAPVNKMMVSPNPFSTSLHFVIPVENIKSIGLYSGSGVLIKQWNGTASAILNVGDVQRGNYVLHVTDKSNQVFMQKLMKE